jgi:hypothetical protein
MLTYKEFYIWLDGFMTNRNWTDFKQGDIETIQEKMKEVKENKLGMFDPTIIPINPLINPNGIDPYKPPYEVYCGTKDLLTD